METNDLTALSIAEAAALIVRRRVSPVELTDAYLARIERQNPLLNAYVTVTGGCGAGGGAGGGTGDRAAGPIAARCTASRLLSKTSMTPKGSARRRGRKSSGIACRMRTPP